MSIEMLQFQGADIGTEQSERETLIDDRQLLHKELGRIARERSGLQALHSRIITMLVAPDSTGYEAVPISRDYIKKELHRVTLRLCAIHQEELETISTMTAVNQNIRAAGMDDNLLIAYIQSAETTGIRTDLYESERRPT